MSMSKIFSIYKRNDKVTRIKRFKEKKRSFKNFLN